MSARRRPSPGASRGLSGARAADVLAQPATDAGSEVEPGAPVEVAAPVTFAIPESLVEAIAMRAAEMVAGHLAQPEAWIGVEEAAAHLACPVSRVYREVSRAKPGGRDPSPIPFRKDGQRVLFRRSELDAWLARGGHREERVR